jgi:hypothetical protein
MGKMAANLTENSTIRLVWAVSILCSCLFAAFRVGQVCAQVEAAIAANARQDCTLDDHGRRITAGETWAQVHEARDRTRTP